MGWACQERLFGCRKGKQEELEVVGHLATGYRSGILPAKNAREPDLITRKNFRATTGFPVFIRKGAKIERHPFRESLEISMDYKANRDGG
jgi:hypothetical protein